MSNDYFTLISSVIRERRTVKPDKMNGEKIPDQQILNLLELANWAPTHGRTEPWRFVVYAGSAVQSFCREHAAMYLDQTSAETYLQANFDKLLHMGDKASHIIIAIMKRGQLPKIPVLEEVAATACAVQNLLLGAAAACIAAYWGSGGMAHHPAMKTYLGLEEHDLVMGILYLGYANQTANGLRESPVSEKITWHG